MDRFVEIEELGVASVETRGSRVEVAEPIGYKSLFGGLTDE